MVTTLNRKSLRALGKSGHHNVLGRNQEVACAVHSARLCVTSLQDGAERDRDRESERTGSQRFEGIKRPRVVGKERRGKQRGTET